jgi:hypothetical protein
MIALLFAACAYHVAIESQPTSALVQLPDGAVAVTPAWVELRWAPLKKQTVTVTARGYRPVTLDVTRRPLRFAWFEEPPATVPVFRMDRTGGPPRIEVVLVPEHGGAGTWTEGDVP